MGHQKVKIKKNFISNLIFGGGVGPIYSNLFGTI